MAKITLAPDHPRAPKYWRNETGGRLQPAIEAYIRGEPLSTVHIGLIRAYLRQWIDSPVWAQDDTSSMGKLRVLRESVDRIVTEADLDGWLHSAVALGIDPL